MQSDAAAEVLSQQTVIAPAIGSVSWNNWLAVHDLVKYFRANPQVFLLLVICLVLGIGTFLIVIIALITSGSTTTTGEPEGLILALRLLGV